MCSQLGPIKETRKNTMSIYNIIFQAVRRDQPYSQLKFFSKFLYSVAFLQL
jgi:hypothetical protein